jgi:hypothetical protein
MGGNKTNDITDAREVATRQRVPRDHLRRARSRLGVPVADVVARDRERHDSHRGPAPAHRRAGRDDTTVPRPLNSNRIDFIEGEGRKMGAIHSQRSSSSAA